MSNRLAILILLLLATVCFAAATFIEPTATVWSSGQQTVLKIMLGDAQRLFADHFYRKADVYLHSGYYPSIFDSGKKEDHLTEHHDKGEEEEPSFLGPPKDIFEKIGRNFMVTEHTHLEHGQEREILPWLKISAELDPQSIKPYTVGAYFLAEHLGKVQEAEQFLREGLRANPHSYEILFALGKIYWGKYHDAARAQNVWELALRRWREQEPQKKEPDNFTFEEITINLARLEEQQGNFARAIEYLREAKAVSPSPQTLQEQITEDEQKLARHPAPDH